MFAEVTRFDAATGQNTLLSGDAVASSDALVSDVVRLETVVEGALEYDNIMGGSTTAVERSPPRSSNTSTSLVTPSSALPPRTSSGASRSR